MVATDMSARMRQQRSLLQKRRKEPPWRTPRECKLCSQQYMPRRKWQIYCSQRCRQAAYEAEHPRTGNERRPIIVQTQADLFEGKNKSLQAGLDALEETTQKHAQFVARLVPIVQALAESKGKAGVTVSDLRLHLEKRGLRLPNKKQRDLSFLGSVMKEAGLKHSGQYRRSEIPESHGNVQVVWVADG
jgi:hypothetical protein